MLSQSLTLARHFLPLFPAAGEGHVVTSVFQVGVLIPETRGALSGLKGGTAALK